MSLKVRPRPTLLPDRTHPFRFGRALRSNCQGGVRLLTEAQPDAGVFDIAVPGTRFAAAMDGAGPGRDAHRRDRQVVVGARVGAGVGDDHVAARVDDVLAERLLDGDLPAGRAGGVNADTAFQYERRSSTSVTNANGVPSRVAASRASRSNGSSGPVSSSPVRRTAANRADP